MGFSHLTTNFGGAYCKIYAYFEQKTAFVMQKFRNLVASGVGVTIFDETQKGASLADFTRFEPCVQIRLRFFSLGD